MSAEAISAAGREPRTRELLGRLRRGELESVQVLVMLAGIWAVFTLLNPRFLSAINLTNLVLQIAAVGLISTGIVLVLLLGEIDLSAAAVSGLAAGIMAVLSVRHGVPGGLAIVAALLAGGAVGLLQGLVVTSFGVPSFVVTLAGLLGWQGALLAVLGSSGTVNLDSALVTGLTSTFMAPAVGWLVAAAVVGLHAGSELLGRARRRAAGLPVPSAARPALRVGFTAVGAAAAVWVLNGDRGVPLAALLLLAVVAGVDWITRRTRFGRRIYAVGANAEAARRAGIPVRRVRLAVFAAASTLAAAGGVLAASRLLAVNQSSGGGDLLLLAIAGPVVAGTSLFGGRGSAWSALTGALVIGSVSNGMDLLGLESSVKFMVTGAVLLGAVVLTPRPARAPRASVRRRKGASMQVGLVGLGKMGAIVARRLLRGGHAVAGFDLEPARAAALEPDGLAAHGSLAALVEALAPPRVVWLMLPSGGPVGAVLAELEGRLEPGDVVLEGGNSDFRLSQVHAARLAGRGVALLDVGVSGGIWGLDDGCGLLVGGDEAAVALAAPALAAVAAPDGWAHVGPSGAGHYAKMVHNAIEYGVMQAYAEGYELLTAAPVDVDPARTIATWNVACSIRAWLLGHLATVLAENPCLEGVPARVGDSGQGRWSVEQAVGLGVPVPAIAAAVFARLGSQQEEAPAMQAIAALRRQVGGHAAPAAA